MPWDGDFEIRSFLGNESKRRHPFSAQEITAEIIPTTLLPMDDG